jgi:two-component system sensor histidine kinase TtrS
MESHGGQISLMSVEPHGCIVSLSLPYWAKIQERMNE